MGKNSLTFYVDIVSPFAYLAYYVTRHSPAFRDVEITYVPVQIGSIMKACNNQPPINIKNKDKFIEKERNRWAQLYSIPIASKAPDNFPVPTITAYWVDRNVSRVDQPEGIVNALKTVFGSEAEVNKFLEQAKTPEIKQLLARRVQEAVDQGSFGLPYMIATNSKGETDSFWGFDHIGLALRHMGLDKLQPLGGSGDINAML